MNDVKDDEEQGIRDAVEPSVQSGQWEEHVRKLYRRGVSISDEKKAYHTVIDRRFMSDRVDWEEDADITEEKLKLLVRAALQFHYMESSQLIACGRIVEHGPTIPAKRLGLLLGMSHMAYIDMWGNYARERGDVLVGRISNRMDGEDMVSKLLEEANVVNLLVWIGAVGTVAMGTLLKYGGRASDPVFTRVSDRMRAAKREDKQIIRDYLSKTLMGFEEDESIEEHVQDYRPGIRKSILSIPESFQLLGLDEHVVASEVMTHVNEFYRSIGIELERLK